jgi:hypothetical protein
MFLLVAIGIIAFVFSLFLLVSPTLIKQSFSNVFDGITFGLEEKTKPYRLIIGILLIVAAVWLFFNIGSPELAVWLYPVCVLAFVFGILYVFFPGWLVGLSGLFNQNVLMIDDLVYKMRKTIGVIVLLASFYIFYIAYLMQ